MTTQEQISDEQWEEICQQLIKLRNLKEQPGTVAEGAAAGAAIERLLFKYNLTMAEAEARSGDKSKDEKIRNFGFDLGVKTGWLMEWRRDLLFVIADFNFCRGLHYARTSGAIILGEERNVQVVKELYIYLNYEIRMLCNKAWKAANQLPRRERSWREAFYYGAVAEVAHRFWEEREAMKKEYTGSTALVVQTEKELTEAMNRLYPNITDIDAKDKRHDPAYWQGVKAASDLELKPKKKLGGRQRRPELSGS